MVVIKKRQIKKQNNNLKIYISEISKKGGYKEKQKNYTKAQHLIWKYKDIQIVYRS